MSYSEIKESHWSKGWRIDLWRNTQEYVEIKEIDRIYSIEYDWLYDNPLVADSLNERIDVNAPLGSWSDEERDDIFNQEYTNHFSQMVKRNVTEEVWEIYHKRQAEKEVDEVLRKIDEHAEVQRLEKQAEQAFESRLYGQSSRYYE